MNSLEVIKTTDATLSSVADVAQKIAELKASLKALSNVAQSSELERFCLNLQSSLITQQNLFVYALQSEGITVAK
jgi:hypothetical protein